MMARVYTKNWQQSVPIICNKVTRYPPHASLVCQSIASSTYNCHQVKPNLIQNLSDVVALHPSVVATIPSNIMDEKDILSFVYAKNPDFVPAMEVQNILKHCY